MMRAPKLVILAVCVLPFVLAACGGGSSNNSADEDQITKAIEFAATSGDPKACTEVQTQKFTDQTSGGSGATGPAAVQSCEKDAASGVADKVEVSDINVDGNSATANAAVTGSVFDGQTLDIALVKEGSQWKLDQFKGFEDFDRNAMITGLVGELSKEGVPTPGVDCIKTQLDKQTDDQLKAFFLDPNSTGAQTIFGPCQQFFRK